MLMPVFIIIIIIIIINNIIIIIIIIQQRCLLSQAFSSRYFSWKCRLFHNATLFGSCIILFYLQGVLKFKYKIPALKG